MARAPEVKVKDAIKKRLEYYGVLPFMKAVDEPGGVNGMYWMPVQAQFAVAGVHDFCGVWDGWFFTLEAKAPDNKEDATPNQRAFQIATIKSQGISFVGVRDASAVDELYRIIQERKSK